MKPGLGDRGKHAHQGGIIGSSNIKEEQQIKRLQYRGIFRFRIMVQLEQPPNQTGVPVLAFGDKRGPGVRQETTAIGPMVVPD